MSKLNRIIKCLEEIMNQEDYMNVNSEYLEKLNQYNDVYQKYFNTNEFNITFEDLTDKMVSANKEKINTDEEHEEHKKTKLLNTKKTKKKKKCCNFRFFT